MQRPQRKPLRIVQRDAAIVADYESGLSTKVIKRKYVVNGSRLCRILKAAGVRRRTAAERLQLFKASATIAIDVEALVARYVAGESALAIAASLDVSYQTVFNRLHQAGVTTRGRGYNGKHHP